MEQIRLQKFISNSGVTSRRKAEELILKGKVKINNKVVTKLGVKVCPLSDVVSVNNKIIKIEPNKIYIKLNKPIGYVTTVREQFGRPCVVDLIDIKDRIYPIGRLDYNTSGLLLLTNDGNITNKLTHPKYKVYKTYITKIKGQIKDNDIEELRKGVDIGNYITAPAIVRVLKKFNNKSIIEISIHEGKNRQIRKMLNGLGYQVLDLERISFGKLRIDNLKPGEWKYLTTDEINYIKDIGGLHG